MITRTYGGEATAYPVMHPCVLSIFLCIPFHVLPSFAILPTIFKSLEDLTSMFGQEFKLPSQSQSNEKKLSCTLLDRRDMK